VQHEQQLKKFRGEHLALQRTSILACERRFAEAGRQYRHAVEHVQAHPAEVAAQCTAMVRELVSEILQEGDSVIRLLTEVPSDKASLHPVNVMVVSLLLGKALGFEAGALGDLGVAAFLHDIGKINLPERVRWPDDGLTKSEYGLYQDHLGESLRLAKTMGLSAPATRAIGQHHELADGSGFPLRVVGASMTPAGKILSLVNRYDNLCNPVRSGTALTPHEALAHIFAQLKSRFDPVVLSAFIRMMGVYPPGSLVQLIDDRYAMVMSVNSTRPLKPRLLLHEAGVPRHEALILDLEQAPNVSIRRSLKPSSLPAATMEYLAPKPRVNYFFDHVGHSTELETTS
jgi:HD-GYP domain-containing protein (c-di-GMP phosphodiesterase class II)